MPSTRNRTATKVTKSLADPVPTKRKATPSVPVPERDILSPTSTAHSLTPPPPSSPSKRRKLSPEYDFFTSPPTQRPPASRFRYNIKPIDPKYMIDHVADMREMIRDGRSMSPVGNVPLGGPSSSITLVGEDEAEDEEEEEVFQPTTLPWNMQNLGEHPALLVKCQRNWFPAYLTGFKPVTTRAGKEAKQRDMWEIQAHPATAWAGVKALSKENIMYLDDDRLAECVLGKIDTQVRQYLSDARTRSSSPPPPLTAAALPAPEDFSHLDRLDQFRLLRPHLSELINESYAPAQWRIDRFFSESKSKRKSSLIKFLKYGDISEDEAVNVFIPDLERWALRGCKPESDQADPPAGSPQYNSLSIPQKHEYVRMILLPEIIIRICLASYETKDLLRDPITSPHPTESELYDLARAKLGDLNLESPEKRWARIINEIQWARAGTRRRLGLPEENLSAYEKEQALLRSEEYTEGWAGGRIRKKKKYCQEDGK